MKPDLPLPTVLIDKREKAPYTFLGLRDDAPVSTRSAHLTTGDYSLESLANLVAVERKSLLELFATAAERRRAFKRELGRLASMQTAAVVVEAPYADITLRPPPNAGALSGVVKRLVMEWRKQHPHVRWYFTESRRAAERLTLTLLEQFWRGMSLPHAAQPALMPSWESPDWRVSPDK